MIKFVPVGDSYTKCEGATKEQSWPFLLVEDLKKHGIEIELSANPAKVGWMTEHIIDLELPLFEQYQPNFATLLIGANDWVQEVSNSDFETNLKTILDKMQKVLPDPEKLILLTIPDFSVTQVGQILADQRDVTKGIQEYNQIIKQEAEIRHLSLVDLFPISQDMRDNWELVSSDGLHPSAKEYALWEKAIFPTAIKILNET